MRKKNQNNVSPVESLAEELGINPDILKDKLLKYGFDILQEQILNTDTESSPFYLSRI